MYRHLRTKLHTTSRIFSPLPGNRRRSTLTGSVVGVRRRSAARVSTSVWRRWRCWRRPMGRTVSTCVARRVRRVGVEDLSVKGRLRAKRFSGAVADAAMSRLVARVGVKVVEAGGEVSVVSRWYPSTRLCSGCRERTARIPRGHAGLRVRRWTCESCGAAHDRDVNAARNLDPAAWSGRGDAASCAESENACGGVCQSSSRESSDGGGPGEAGSAIARNPHAGATSSSVGGALANGVVTRVVAGACAAAPG